MNNNQVGAIITTGATDWQIFQQDARGHGTISLVGRWVHDANGQVEVRVVDQATGVALNTQLDWHPATTARDGTWQTTLTEIPVGGLYRLETRYRPTNVPTGEWAPRGDMRHFLGVGDLWVIAGQSNSAGYGRGPYHDAPELGLHLFRNSETWALATHPLNDSTDTKHPCNREGSNSAHSPYLHFARILKQELGYPIGLVPTALGGSALAAWNPVENPTAVLCENMLHSIALVGGRIRGIVWYQGESDTGNEPTATSYARRFMEAVTAWRQALRQPALPVLTVQLNRAYSPADETAHRNWSRVRECQRQVARQLAGVTVVPSFDLPLCDLVHISPAGNLLLGDRLARAALATVNRHAAYQPAPDLQSARASGDGTVIELNFSPVTSRIDNMNASANPFHVEDAGGAVPITKVGYPHNATVQLTLGRPLTGRAVVHGGLGRNPDTMPMDFERFMPILGFHNVEVTR
ncbi:MAG: sialate O-acetylesterase [Verrucomicrobiota bacterium]